MCEVVMFSILLLLIIVVNRLLFYLSFRLEFWLQVLFPELLLWILSEINWWAVYGCQYFFWKTMTKCFVSWIVNWWVSSDKSKHMLGVMYCSGSLWFDEIQQNENLFPMKSQYKLTPVPIFGQNYWVVALGKGKTFCQKVPVFGLKSRDEELQIDMLNVRDMS